jgi:hypothetical protein
MTFPMPPPLAGARLAVRFSELPQDMQVILDDCLQGEACLWKTMPEMLEAVALPLSCLPRAALDDEDEPGLLSLEQADQAGYDRGQAYAQAMVMEQTPPIIVADQAWLDGRHRVHQARRLGHTHIWAFDFSGIGCHPVGGLGTLISPVPSMATDEDMRQLWCTPGPAAMEAIERLAAQGMAVNARGDPLDHHGLMEMVKVGWDDQPGQFSLAEALMRVDRWVALGGSLDDEIRLDTVCSLMARFGHAEHIHELLERGATNEVQSGPLIMKVARFCTPEATLALLRSPAKVDLNWRSPPGSQQYRTPFTEMVVHAVEQWKPGAPGTRVLNQLTELIEAWIERGGDLWAGRLENTPSHHGSEARSDVEILASGLDESELPAFCRFGQVTTAERHENKRQFYAAWREHCSGWLDAFLDQESEQGTPEGHSPLRGLWLGVVAHKEDQIKQRVLHQPPGTPIFLPLARLSSLSTEADAWVAVLLTGASVLTAGTSCIPEKLTTFRKKLEINLEKSAMGRAIKGEHFAFQREKKAMAEAPVEPRRRMRSRS